MKDYYKMLGLNIEDNIESIKKAYKKKAIELHPDKNQGDKYYEEKFKEIQEAYSVLYNPKLKAEYDEQYKSRIDFLINQVKIINSLTDETLPDYVKGIYELEIREIRKELSKLYADVKVVDELMYKSFALAQFQMYANHAPKFENFEDEIKYLRDATLKNTLENLKNPFRFTPDEQESFYKLYLEYLISKENGKITEGQFSIRCLFLPEKISTKETRIILLEYMNIIEHYSSYLEAKFKRNKKYINKTVIAQILRDLTHLVNSRSVEEFKSGGIWQSVLGILALGNDYAHIELMENLKKDSSADKIDNIKTITQIAELVFETNDFSKDNMFGISYVIRQLNLYVQNDEDAKLSLIPLKELYYNSVYKLYHSFDTQGKETEASALINHLGEKILSEDQVLRAKLRILWLGDTAKSNYKSKEGCFIATACFGDYDAPEVKKLREYRDTVLSKTILGRMTIKTYYLISPSLVKIIINNSVIRNILKENFLPFLIRKLRT
jgi:curved DNA-binding protein CbpA